MVAFIGPAFAGDFAAWNKRLFAGVIAGDTVGNVALGAHLFGAFVLTIGGTLQLIPWIRTHAPGFHRWNGRLYIALAFATSLSAIYMIWTRDTFGPDILEIPVSINGVLILVFAAITIRYAMARNIETHQRWALRTFMMMSGVWFTRIMYRFLGAFPGDIPGSTEDMAGPTNVVVAYASFLLPLAVGMVWLSWPVFMNAYVSGEISGNAGGLIRWPARLMIPIGFLLLSLQGISELIKRVAVMQGLIPDPYEKKDAVLPITPISE